MRAAKMLFTGSLAAAVVAILACGGSSQEPAGSPGDSGAGDVANGPSTDSSVPPQTDGATTLDAALDASVACTIDADLNTTAPPDAALNTTGASVGTCIGCAKTNCPTQIDSCNQDCTCNNVFSCLFECLGSVGGTLIGCYTGTCGGALPGTGGASADQAEIKLLECAAKACAPACDAQARCTPGCAPRRRMRRRATGRRAMGQTGAMRRPTQRGRRGERRGGSVRGRAGRAPRSFVARSRHADG